MSIRIYACIALATTILISVQEGAAQGLTEKELLRRFAEESPRARALKAGVEMVRAEMRGRSLPPNPTVGYSREDAAGSKENYLLVGQSLPLSGRLGLLRRAGDAAVNAQREQSSHSLQQLRADLRLAFYDLLLALQRDSIIRQGVSELQEVVRVLREREREGEGSAFDRLRAERELADTQAELISLEAMASQARTQVASFLAPGTDPITIAAKGEFDIGRALPSLPELVARALETRGDYRAEEEQLQRFQFERRAAGRLRIPEPVFSAGLKQVHNPVISDTGHILSLTVPIPLYNRGQTDAALAQAAYQRSQAERQALEQQIATEVKAAYAATELRRRLAQEYRREVGDKGIELARIARVAYQEGEQRILELLDAYRVTLSTQLRVLELVAGAKQAEIELDRAVGEEVFP
jgi:cobalt-zinc-cadmium efflux system outer membrane protein